MQQAVEINNVADLYLKIKEEYLQKNAPQFIILIGGCSRTGKSTLANKLKTTLITNHISCIIVPLDAWLIDIDKRPPGSTVLQRYNLEGINNSVEALINGNTIIPPVYDVVTRKITDNGSAQPISLKHGVIVIEGVIALANNWLLKKADLCVFTTIDDGLRIERLMHFYQNVKNLEENTSRNIIFGRENEEIPFIKKTSVNADVIFSWHKNP